MLLRLIYIGAAQLIPDEAYYWNYAQHMDLSFFDHPPMVAWLIWLGTGLFGDNEFGVRVGAVICGLSRWAICMRWLIIYTISRPRCAPFCCSQYCLSVVSLERS